MSQRSKKRQSLKAVSVVDIRCSSNSCKKPNLSDVFNPIPLKPRNTLLNYHHFHSSSSSSVSSSSATPSNRTTAAATATATATEDYSSSSYATSSPLSSAVRRLGRLGGEGVAVEKDSDDPYLDFRQSMLHMILENEIYSKDDLRELLSCFLRLNSPFHHAVILRAFTEIWDGVFSSSSSAAAKRTGASPLVAGPYVPCVSRDLF